MEKILEETADNSNYLSKKNINFYNSWTIIVFSWLASITLIISLVLWICFLKKETEELLYIIDNIITKKFFKFNLTFTTLTIAVLGFGFIILGVVAFPFIFLKNNDFISLILTKTILLISLFFIVGSTLFISFGYPAFYKYVSEETIRNILFFIIPWVLEVFYFLLLILFCLIFIKKNRQNKYINSDMNLLHLQNEINKETVSSIHDNNEKISWTSEQIEEVWNKGEIINNLNPQLYRKDYAGALMFWHSFISQSKLNDLIESLKWTIVYEKPIAKGGSNYIKNLVPMNNNNAVIKSNNFPRWTTSVTYDSKKNKNIFKKKSWKYKKIN